MFGGGPACAAAHAYTVNNGTITMTGYTGAGGDVAIPDTIAGLPVTGIGDAAFLWLHHPDQCHDPQQRHQHWRRCVLWLHQPDRSLFPG